VKSLIFAIIVKYLDREFGADYLAQTAAEAFVLIYQRGNRIPLGIDFLANFQSLTGTKLRTIAAAFTPLFVDDYLTGLDSF